MKTALFGGSFNPIHNGHINLVMEINKALNFDKIIIMPANISPFKKDDNIYTVDNLHRLMMCKLAFEDLPNVIVSSFEIEKNDISFTINTLEYFHEKFPDDELYFIMGSDMLLSFEKWHRYKDILKLCTITVASRIKNEADFKELSSQADKLSQYGSIKLVSISAFEMSSSIIREKIIKNEDISCYVPQNVVKYIRDMNLYF